MKIVIGIIVILVILSVGGSIATYVLSGVLMFAGLVAMVESIGILKWLFRHTSSLVDILIFGFTVFAMSHMGATVSISLSVAGLLFTIIYKPMLVGNRSVNRVVRKAKKS